MATEFTIEETMAKISEAKKRAESLLELVSEIVSHVEVIELEQKQTECKLADVRTLIKGWKAKNVSINDEAAVLEKSLAKESEKFSEVINQALELQKYFKLEFEAPVGLLATGKKSNSPPEVVPVDVACQPLRKTIGSQQKYTDITEQHVFEEVIISFLRISDSMSRKEIRAALENAMGQRFTDADMALTPDDTPTWWHTTRSAIDNLLTLRRIARNPDDGTFRLNNDLRP